MCSSEEYSISMENFFFHFGTILLLSFLMAQSHIPVKLAHKSCKEFLCEIEWDMDTLWH